MQLVFYLPSPEGLDDSRKVQESMEVMRNIVLHALGLGKGGTGGTPTVQSSGRNTSSVKKGQLKQQHISPDSSLMKATHGPNCPVVPPGSRNSSGIGSIADEDNSDTSPLQQSLGNHMQQSHDGHVTTKHPKSPFIHQVENTLSHAAKEKEVHKPASSVQRSNGAEVSQIDRKTPQRPASKRGGGSGGVVETRIAHMVRSEDEKRKLVMTVQELQIKVKEEEIRSVQSVCDAVEGEQGVFGQAVRGHSVMESLTSGLDAIRMPIQTVKLDIPFTCLQSVGTAVQGLRCVFYVLWDTHMALMC